MSLNGLEGANIGAAYEGALKEAGGWLLLKYCSRDRVELLNHGTGGVAEAREAVSYFRDISPLYGFIHYRSWKVVLKYIPEGTSRLLQARVSVHFQSVIEKFTPHDAILPLVKFSDLKDATLSAACCLHTTSASISSSNGSDQQRRLGEVAEDGGESARAIRASMSGAGPKDVEPQPTFEKNVVLHYTEDAPIRGDRDREEIRQKGSFSAGSPGNKYKEQTDLSAKVFMARNRQNSSETTYKFESQSRPSVDRRQSSQSTRMTTRDLYNESSYGSKPKVKLGPRPSLELAGRSQTTGNHSRQSEPRPVSTLPAGIRIAPRQTMMSRPKSQQSTCPLSHGFSISTVPPIPQVPVFPRTMSRTSNMTPEKVLSNSTPSPTLSPASKSSIITPEKQRLMKALQLRKKHMTTPIVAEGTLATTADTDVREPSVLNDLVPLKDPKKSIEEPENELTRLMEPDLDLETQFYPETNRTDAYFPGSSPVSPVESSNTTSTEASSFSEVKGHEQQQVKEIKIAVGAMNVSDEKKAPNATGDLRLGSSKAATDNRGEPNQHTNERTYLTHDDPTSFGVYPETVPLPSVGSSEEAFFSASQHPSQSNSQIAPPPMKVDQVQPPANSVIVASSREGQGADADLSSSEDEVRRKMFDERNARRKLKRDGVVEPIVMDLNADDSEDNFLADESFMEELKFAKMQEAKPISVSKSPITSVFPKGLSDRRPSDSSSSYLSRVVSSPQPRVTTPDNDQSSPVTMIDEAPRSMSAFYARNTERNQAPVALAKKVNVSSGISRRIKALEMLSSRETSPNNALLTPTPNAYIPSSTLEPRKSFTRISKSASTPTSTQPSSPMMSRLSPSPSPSPSPESINVQKRPSETSRQGNVAEVKPKDFAGLQTQSVSVTARIMRDTNLQQPEPPKVSSEPFFLELYRSPLIIEHQATSSRAPRSEPKSLVSDDVPVTFSSCPPLRNETRTPRPLSLSTVRTTSDRSRSEARSTSPARESSSNVGDTTEEKKEEKKGSRTSRLFRRMSSMSSVSRRSLVNAISPSVKEEEPGFDTISHMHSAQLGDVEIGDVNIQFPDTLFWKRRYMKIDDQGYMVLTKAMTDQYSKAITKRYHLSDFRPPSIPDQDRQELPYSIILDFCDGSTLQCACENIAGQANVFKLLHSAYRSWAGAV
ncbi:MAG: hypothetical protein M1827_001402 [Pycnora praestabilis]|nr:MAG: hypothetical protein M1827_001402 [Pycnora praestabilis]